MDNKENLKKVILDLKEKIKKIEDSNMKLSETDTRQGLINHLFRALGWDFSNFESVKSEYKTDNYGESADYAFFTSDKEKPALVLEAKAFDTDLNKPQIVKQLCSYLGQMGVKWGVISDGNKYVMYNFKAGLSFEDKRFFTLQIKTVDTEDGLPLDELVDKFYSLLSHSSLESDEIQKTYENHIVNDQLRKALDSLLAEPFDTLAKAIKREFKEERIHANPDLKISTNRVISFLKEISDEEGKIRLDSESEGVISQESMMNEISEKGQDSSDEDTKSFTGRQRVTVFNLLEKKLIAEGDNWKLNYKGEIYWGRITGTGELEVDGKLYKTPSKAGEACMKRACSGWQYWQYKDAEGKWHNISLLRQKYREEFGYSVSYSEEQHLENTDDNTKEIYNQLKSRILEFNPELQFNPQKRYVSVKGSKNHAFLVVRKNHLQLVILSSLDKVKKYVSESEVLDTKAGVKKSWNSEECSLINIKKAEELDGIMQALVPTLPSKKKAA